MKKRRILKSVAKRNKKEAFKNELRQMRQSVMKNNRFVSPDRLAEYRAAKLRLMKVWYPERFVKTVDNI